jgi:hypothetical protein
VESAKAVNPAATPKGTVPPVVAKATPAGKKGKLAKNQKPTPTPSVAAAAPPVVAQQSPPPAAVKTATTPAQTPASAPVAVSSPAIAAASPATGANGGVEPSTAPGASVAASAPPITAPGGALASTAGGGSWKTFAPGKMPLGRLIETNDLKDLADRGLVGERIYLKGQFVVNFSDANKAVLRPRARLASAMLHLGGSGSTRIIVEFPAGYTPPAQGSVVSRDDARPLEITEVRKEDGQLNVFAREIMQ